MTILSLEEPLLTLFVDLIPLEWGTAQTVFLMILGPCTNQTAWLLVIRSVQRADMKPTVFMCSAKLDLMTSAGVSSVQAFCHAS